MGRKSVHKDRIDNDKAREKLVTKCMVYFQNYGTGATMSKLAREISVSKTTIYNHFKTKEDLVFEATQMKLSIISDYESVLNNVTLPYLERYRKAMLFFCVQFFDISAQYLKDMEQNFPETWDIMVQFQDKVFEDLLTYYKKGVEKGIFISDIKPELLTLDDQLFFNSLSNPDGLKKYQITILDAFKHHFQTKFFSIISEGKTSSF